MLQIYNNLSGLLDQQRERKSSCYSQILHIYN